MATIARGSKAGGGTNFNSGQTIDPAEVNTDLNTIVTEINGALDDGNIETATIPGAKSLRGTEISAPSSPSSNDILLYAFDDDGVTVWATKDSAGNARIVNRTATAGSGTGKVYLAGILSASAAAGANTATTSEEVLHSHSIAAAALGATGSATGESLTIHAMGTLGSTNNNKAVRLRLNGIAGSVIVDSGTVATNNAEWLITGRIVRVGTNSVSCYGTLLIGAAGAATGAVSVHRFNALFAEAVTLSAAWTIDITGQSPTTGAANDVTCAGSWITLCPWKA